ncbi:MAG: hypothetical protein HZB65_00005 [Candidatus Aenigmarchaeota archaeon]|nr:hypothetical protein [Candidatus Aenigmarchaeota archaeon]
MELKGKVCKGLGNFSWLPKEQQNFYNKETSVVLAKGSLNVSLEEPIDFNISDYSKFKRENTPHENEYVLIIPCKISALGKTADGFIQRRQKVEESNGHPKNIIEIISSVHFSYAFVSIIFMNQ